jgi:hypothetical protein
MNLVSCDNCGTVVDADKNQFPTDLVDGDGCINDENAAWNGDDFVPIIKCPSCNDSILKEQ